MKRTNIIIQISILMFVLFCETNAFISPQGGENGRFLEQGATQRISWDITDFEGYVDITLWDMNSATYTTIADDVMGLNGEYFWTIPTNHPTGYFFRIRVQQANDASNYQMSGFIPIYPQSSPALSVEDNSYTNPIIIMPNPSETQSVISWFEEIKTIRIIDFMGRSLSLLQVNGKRELTLQTANYAVGSYYLVFEKSDGSLETKCIKIVR